MDKNSFSTDEVVGETYVHVSEVLSGPLELCVYARGDVGGRRIGTITLKDASSSVTKREVRENHSGREDYEMFVHHWESSKALSQQVAYKQRMAEQPLQQAAADAKLLLQDPGQVTQWVERNWGSLFPAEGGSNVKLIVSGYKLMNPGTVGQPDPFLRILRSLDSGDTVVALETKPQHDTLYPSFSASVSPLDLLGPGRRPDTSLVLEVFDHQDSGSHRPMGSAAVLAKDLVALCIVGELELMVRRWTRGHRGNGWAKELGPPPGHVSLGCILDGRPTAGFLYCSGADAIFQACTQELLPLVQAQQPMQSGGSGGGGSSSSPLGNHHRPGDMFASNRALDVMNPMMRR